MLVYVSGIIILLIFVIMLTNTIEDDSIKIPWVKKFIYIIIPCLFFIINAFIIIFAIPNKALNKHNIVAYDESNLAKIGFKILDINQNGYVLPFEILSILLLIVLIGCLKISRK
jgi:NADH-quinone oxidoreductase subunit J